MSSRRDFIRSIAGSAALIGLTGIPMEVLAKHELVKLTILHTNDVHSRIDPFPENDPKYPGMAGVARRSALIRKIRSEEKNVLLLDSGDIFQGTPYFNLYGGELELSLMSDMGYDAATLGNHDFDNGMDGLLKQMPHAKFPFINLNYDFSDTPLNEKIIPYKIFQKGGLTIGVIGLGIELQGLVDAKLYGNTRYIDPVIKANTTARLLKQEMKCQLVICLSHLGYKYNEKKISDEILAQQTSNIDLILGGHTHTFLDEPVHYKNTEGKDVMVAQVGWAGIRLGRIDYYFNVHSGKKESFGSSVKISEKTIAV
ncbi:MAG: metallophosphatase [Bacteroidetes bacterium]|nr:metallophosphatase [Bacteroidota bacterium]